MTCFAKTRRVLRRRHELDGAEQRRREKQRKGNGGERRWRRLYSAAKKHGEATQQPSPTSLKPEMATGTTGSRRKLTDGEVSPAGTVHYIYRIATRLISKLLPNLYSNSKISKNKSCSNLIVLQLCFNNHTQIMSIFRNASLKSKGDTLRIYPFSNYFKFYITTLKTPKIKLCTP